MKIQVELAEILEDRGDRKLHEGWLVFVKFKDRSEPIKIGETEQ